MNAHSLSHDLLASMTPQETPTHYTGFIVSLLRRALRIGGDRDNAVTIDNHQQNAAHGVHQARVRLAGDPTTYRLILAPADAPMEIYGRRIGDAFPLPLGDA